MSHKTYEPLSWGARFGFFFMLIALAAFFIGLLAYGITDQRKTHESVATPTTEPAPAFIDIAAACEWYYGSPPLVAYMAPKGTWDNLWDLARCDHSDIAPNVDWTVINQRFALDAYCHEFAGPISSAQHVLGGFVCR